MAQQRPGRGFEEGMRLYIAGAGTGAKTAKLVFYEQLTDERLAKTDSWLVVH